MNQQCNEMGACELTEQELALIQGGGVWDKLEKAGGWVKDKVTDAWNSITSPKAIRNYKAVSAILGVLTAVVTIAGPPGGSSARRDNEPIH